MIFLTEQHMILKICYDISYFEWSLVVRPIQVSTGRRVGFVFLNNCSYFSPSRNIHCIKVKPINSSITCNLTEVCPIMQLEILQLESMWTFCRKIWKIIEKLHIFDFNTWGLEE